MLLASILIANDLMLLSKVYKSGADISAIQLVRINNRPKKSHLLLTGEVGLWFGEEWLIGSTNGAELVLKQENGVLTLLNKSCDSVTIDGAELKKNHYTSLKGERVILHMFNQYFLIQRRA